MGEPYLGKDILKVIRGTSQKASCGECCLGSHLRVGVCHGESEGVLPRGHLEIEASQYKCHPESKTKAS